MEQSVEKWTVVARGRSRSFDRDEALDRALRLFWDHGYDGVSIGRLCQAAGIAPPSLYAAFKSKEDLYREAALLYARRYGDPIFAAASEETDPADAIARLLAAAAAAFADIDTPAGCFAATGLLTASPGAEDLKDVAGAMRRATRNWVKARLEQAIVAGVLSKALEADLIADYVAMLIEGLAVQARDGMETERLTMMATLSAESCRNLIAAYR